MKKTSQLFIILPVSLFLVVSCNWDSKKAERILQSAENALEQYPDSALRLLDSIPNPYDLNEGQQAKYALLSVEAKYKAYKDISSDTLIFKAKDYFKKKKDFKYRALAAFYSGRVSESRQKLEEALTAFLEAESVAITSNDKSLAGFIQFNIGDAYYRNGHYDEAIVKLKQACENQKQDSDGYKKEIKSLDFIASNFVMKKNIDSAFVFYKNALSNAANYNDSTEIASVLQNMGATFLKTNKIDEAKPKLLEALRYSTDSIQTAKIYLNLAKVYSNSITDSAYFYISNALYLAEKNDDKKLQASIYYYRSKLDEKTGNYKTSLEHYKKYADFVSSVYNERQKANYIEVQNKYDFEIIRHENAILLIEKQRILILFLLSTLVLFFVAFIYYRKRKRDQEVILLAKNEIYQLKEIINNLDSKDAKETDVIESEKVNDITEKNNKFKKTIAKQFGILNRIALLEDTMSAEDREKGKDVLKRIYKIVYEHSDRYNWNILNDSINDLYDGYADKLRKIAPHLSETDYRICYLTKADFTNSQIAGFLDLTKDALQSRKKRIRKTLKMQNSKNFIEEMDNLINKV